MAAADAPNEAPTEEADDASNPGADVTSNEAADETIRSMCALRRHRRVVHRYGRRGALLAADDAPNAAADETPNLHSRPGRPWIAHGSRRGFQRSTDGPCNVASFHNEVPWRLHTHCGDQLYRRYNGSKG